MHHLEPYSLVDHTSITSFACTAGITKRPAQHVIGWPNRAGSRCTNATAVLAPVAIEHSHHILKH